MTLFGLDVAMYQGLPNYAQVAGSGISFVVAKATEGTGYVDPTYAANAAAIPAAGLIPGSYHWLIAGAAAAQADHFHDIAGPGIVMLDIEDPTNTPTTADVDAFVARWKSLDPRTLLMYGGRYGPLGKTTTSADGPLWLADYGANAAGDPVTVYAGRGGDAAAQWTRGFNGWTGPTIWQYGSRGTVPGIAGNVDMDAFRGTLAELQALAGMEAEVQLDPSISTSGVADFTPGATVYRDAARTVVFEANWGGGVSIGVVGLDGVNAQKFPSPNVCVNLYEAAPPNARALVYVGQDHMQNYRPRPPLTADPAALETARKNGYNAGVSAVQQQANSVKPI